MACFVVESVFNTIDTSAPVTFTSPVNVVHVLRAYQLKSWSQVLVQDVLPITVKLASVTYLLFDESATSAVVNTTLPTWLFTEVTASVASNAVQLLA